MSNDMIAITGSKLPAHLQKKAKAENVFANAMGVGGFPVVSIKGKVFHISRGDERTLITKPDSDDEPASSINVVILATNPNKSKVYYEHGYEEGSVDKPDCYSLDGVAPAADAESAQAKKCAVCPHNQWGSRITDNGKKGKACADSMRLAIAPAGQLNDPMLLRVPAASLKTLGQYGAQLAKRGVDPMYVVTKIGFDYNVAHPALTFKAIRFIEEEELAEAEKTLQDEEETIANITGASGTTMSEAEQAADEVDDAPKASKSKSKAPQEAEEEAEVKPKKAKVKVEDEDEDEPAPAPKKKAVAQEEAEDEAEPKAKSVEDYNDIDEALDNLDFDD